MARRRALRLSMRVTLFFAITALLGGVLGRDRVTIVREVQSIETESDGWATLIPPDPGDATLPERLDDEIPSRFGFSGGDFPIQLVESVLSFGQSGTQYFTTDDGTPYIGVGVALN